VPPEREHRDEFRQQIGRKMRQKRRSRQSKFFNPWFGVGTFGLVGWAVTIPTLIFIALGIWIDATWESPYSWTLMMLFVGVVLGCLNAWFWVQRESDR